MFLFSCRKIEGQGGASRVVGKVFVRDYDAFGNLKAEYYAHDERVYIIYGSEGNIYDDDFDTSFDGSYEFDFLRKGTYKVFAYQDCNTCPSGEEVVMEIVEVTENKSTVVVPDLILNK